MCSGDKMKIMYDDYDKCTKCDGLNNVKITDITAGCVCEIETICSKCGHEDFWAYGFYESKIMTYDEFKNLQNRGKYSCKS